MMTRVKTLAEQAAIRESGRMLATVLAQLEKEATAGMTTKDLAERAKLLLRPLGGQPAFLGYQGFPDVLCVSVNDEVVHGIPSTKKKIQNGDVVSMDFGVTYRSMITDSATTVVIGKPNEQTRRLVHATHTSLEAAIDVIKAGCKVGDIGAAVQAVLEQAKLGIVRDLVGHGVGHEVHEDPNIANYGRAGSGMRLQAGMTIAVEPMATLGSEAVVVDPDGWTIRTADGSLAAHFEHTLLITETGVEVLTDRTGLAKN